MAYSIAFAPISSGPNRALTNLLIAAATLPHWSRTTTPTPTNLREEKTTPSMFTLNQGGFGGDYRTSDTNRGSVRRWFASWNSSKYVHVHWRICPIDCRAPPRRTWFHEYQRHQAITATSANDSTSNFSWNFSNYNKSINDPILPISKALTKPNAAHLKIQSYVYLTKKCTFNSWEKIHMAKS